MALSSFRPAIHGGHRTANRKILSSPVHGAFASLFTHSTSRIVNRSMDHHPLNNASISSANRHSPKTAARRADASVTKIISVRRRKRTLGPFLQLWGIISYVSCAFQGYHRPLNVIE